MDPRERFDDLADRLRSGRAQAGAPPGSGDRYWAHVQDLFTRGLTSRGVSELLDQEAQETFRFFTREVDFSELASRPWYRRWPAAAWKVFLAIAFRLSPPRRVLFAVAVPVLALALAVGVASRLGRDLFGMPSLFEDLLFAALVLFLLLALELRDKLALKGDLEIAREIQFGLLPFEPIQREAFSVHATMRPANTVGGDYFDVIDLGDDRLGVVVGDVAGKGMPAALLMALVQGSLRTLITAGLRGAGLMAALNRHLHANIPANRLVTLFYAELELASGTLHYVNAGHNPPLHLHADGTVTRLPATAVALGILGETDFEVGEARLVPGDRLLLYTDGVTEAEDPNDQEYGEARLLAAIASSGDVEGPALLTRLRDEVLAFCGRARPRDDMTLVLLSRAAAAPGP